MNANSLMSACEILEGNPTSHILDNVPDSNVTQAQCEAIKKLVRRYERKPDEINIGIIGEPNVIMIRYNSLWIGIETDGYTHS